MADKPSDADEAEANEADKAEADEADAEVDEAVEAILDNAVNEAIELDNQLGGADVVAVAAEGHDVAEGHDAAEGQFAAMLDIPRYLSWEYGIPT